MDYSINLICHLNELLHFSGVPLNFSQNASRATAIYYPYNVECRETEVTESPVPLAPSLRLCWLKSSDVSSVPPITETNFSSYSSASVFNEFLYFSSFPKTNLSCFLIVAWWTNVMQRIGTRKQKTLSVKLINWYNSLSSLSVNRKMMSNTHKGKKENRKTANCMLIELIAGPHYVPKRFILLEVKAHTPAQTRMRMNDIIRSTKQEKSYQLRNSTITIEKISKTMAEATQAILCFFTIYFALMSPRTTWRVTPSSCMDKSTVMKRPQYAGARIDSTVGRALGSSASLFRIGS